MKCLLWQFLCFSNFSYWLGLFCWVFLKILQFGFEHKSTELYFEKQEYPVPHHNVRFAVHFCGTAVELKEDKIKLLEILPKLFEYPDSWLVTLHRVFFQLCYAFIQETQDVLIVLGFQSWVKDTPCFVLGYSGKLWDLTSSWSCCHHSPFPVTPPACLWGGTGHEDVGFFPRWTSFLGLCWWIAVLRILKLSCFT